jgi:DNA-binding NtrC family response regulator
MFRDASGRAPLLLEAPRPVPVEPSWTPRVVLAEDDATCRSSLARSLARRGFHVVPVADGREALESIRAWGADVLVTDLLMPSMDGAELLLRVAEQAPWVRCVAMTGASEAEPRLISAREFGAVATLDKPFEVEQLVAAIWQALGR